MRLFSAFVENRDTHSIRKCTASNRRSATTGTFAGDSGDLVGSGKPGVVVLNDCRPAVRPGCWDGSGGSRAPMVVRKKIPRVFYFLDSWEGS